MKRWVQAFLIVSAILSSCGAKFTIYPPPPPTGGGGQLSAAPDEKTGRKAVAAPNVIVLR